jgi:hypothetical protein
MEVSPKAPPLAALEHARLIVRREQKQSVRREAKQQHAREVYDRLRSDPSPHALGCDNETLEWLIDAAGGDEDEIPVTTAAQQKSHWGKWCGYCAYVRVNPVRPDLTGAGHTDLERERLLWTAALPWIWARMKPAPGLFIEKDGHRVPKPPYPASALAVLRGVRAIHRDDYGIATPALNLAAKRCRGLMMRYRDEYGVIATRHKEPIPHAAICDVLRVSDGAVTLPRKRPFEWGTVFGRSYRTLIHVLAQTGFRRAEVALDPREKWGKKHISFASLTWRIRGRDVPVAEATPQLLATLTEGDYAVLVPPPSKADQFGLRWGSRPIWLPYHATAAINAARALADWECVAGVPPEKRATTPLFCGVGGVGDPLTTTVATDTFERLLAGALGVEEAKKYTLHSFRAYLASSMLAAGCSDTQIQAALRWASEDAVNTYKTINAEGYGSWLLAAEGERLTGTRARNLPRPTPRTDFDDMAAEFLASEEDLNVEALRI